MNIFLFRSQQLPHHGLRPLKAFLNWHGSLQALQGPWTSPHGLLPELQKYRYTVRCVVLVEEVPGQRWPSKTTYVSCTVIYTDMWLWKVNRIGLVTKPAIHQRHMYAALDQSVNLLSFSALKPQGTQTESAWILKASNGCLRWIPLEHKITFWSEGRNLRSVGHRFGMHWLFQNPLLL